MIVLLGIAVVVAGFATRRNPLLVVGVSGVVTGLLGKMSPLRVLDAFGTGFASSRTVTLFVLVLPMIGLLEYHGLREQARTLIGKLRRLGAGPLLAVYLVIRQIAIAFGVNLGGPAQIVRPILAPMAEAAVERKHGSLPEKVRERVRSHAAGADTVGLFFGEDCFVAIGSILLITSFANTNYKTHLQPLDLAHWAIPTAVCAAVIHGSRLLMLDRQLGRQIVKAGAGAGAGAVTPIPAVRTGDSVDETAGIEAAGGEATAPEPAGAVQTAPRAEEAK